MATGLPRRFGSGRGASSLLRGLLQSLRDTKARSPHRVQEEGAAMGSGFALLAQTGDNNLPFIVGGIVVIALVIVVVAFVLMRRR